MQSEEGSSLWKQPEIWAMQHQCCPLCSTDFVNQCHWLLEHAGSHGVSKIVHMGKSHWLPSSQLPGPSLKKCSMWCCSRALNWLEMSCIPDLGAGSQCCAWPPGKPATPQVSQTRLWCKQRGQSCKWRHQSACKHLTGNKRTPGHTGAGPCCSGQRVLVKLLWLKKSVEMFQQTATHSLRSFECLNKT